VKKEVMMSKFVWVKVGWALPSRKSDEIAGVDYYRIVLPAKMLNKYGKHEHRVVGNIAKKDETAVSMWRRVFEEWGTDGMILKNLDTMNAVSQVLGAMKHYDGKLVIDLDDNLNNVDPSSPVYDVYHPNSEGMISNDFLIENCAELWMENENLYHSYKGKKHGKVLPNCIDRESLDMEVIHNPDKKVRIGWLGGATHKKDMEDVFGVLKKVMDKYPNVEFVTMGGDCVNWELLPEDRVTQLPFHIDYMKYLADLPKLGIDIGITPLVNSKFNSCKSPCKFYEYSIGGWCTLSPADFNLPYKRVITNNENGLLYKNKDDMFEKLCLLVENERLRKDLANNARQYLRENMCIQDHWQKWEDRLDTL